MLISFQAYVVFVQMLGVTWLERNISTLVAHVLDLVANPKAASSHVDAVYSRKCISFILRGTIGKMLGEGAQAIAVKEIAHIILKQMNSIGKIQTKHNIEIAVFKINQVIIQSICLQTLVQKTQKTVIKRLYSASIYWFVHSKRWEI